MARLPRLGRTRIERVAWAHGTDLHDHVYIWADGLRGGIGAFVFTVFVCGYTDGQRVIAALHRSWSLTTYHATTCRRLVSSGAAVQDLAGRRQRSVPRAFTTSYLS